MNSIDSLYSLHMQNSSSVKAESMKNGLRSRNDRRLKEACSDFEAIFIKQMLDSMRKTVNKSGLMDGGMAEEIFQDMLYDKYAEKMSKTGNFGIKDILYKQLKSVY